MYLYNITMNGKLQITLVATLAACQWLCHMLNIIHCSSLASMNIALWLPMLLLLKAFNFCFSALTSLLFSLNEAVLWNEIFDVVWVQLLKTLLGNALWFWTLSSHVSSHCYTACCWPLHQTYMWVPNFCWWFLFIIVCPSFMYNP